MLMFKGVPLPDKVEVSDIEISTPKVTRRTLDVPSRRGLIYSGGKLGNRAITMSLAMLVESATEALQLHRRLCDWAYSAEPSALVLPGMEDKYLLAQCDSYPTPSFGEWWREFDMSFICDRPEFISAFPHTKTLTNGALTDTHNTMPLIIGGGLPTPLEIRLTLGEDVTGLNLYIDSTQLSLSGSIAAGEIVFDTESGAVTLDGEDITYLATIDSELVFEIEPGRHSFGWPLGVQLTGEVTWRERWL